MRISRKRVFLNIFVFAYIFLALPISCFANVKTWTNSTINQGEVPDFYKLSGGPGLDWQVGGKLYSGSYELIKVNCNNDIDLCNGTAVPKNDAFEMYQSSVKIAYEIDYAGSGCSSEDGNMYCWNEAYIIALVDKETGAKGHIYLVTDSGGNDPNRYQRVDDLQVIVGYSEYAPKEELFSKITINGTINFIDSGGKVVKPANKYLFGALRVRLVDSQGFGVKDTINGKNAESEIVASGDSYSYGFSGVTLYSNTLYTLQVDPESRNIDCNTDMVNGGDFDAEINLGMCSLRMSGAISFMIDENGTIIEPLSNNNSDLENSNIGHPMNDYGANGKGLVVDLSVEQYLESALDKALSTAIKWLASVVEKALKWVMGGIEYLLDKTQEIVMDGGISDAWGAIRNLALSLIILLIIVMAFSNVLQIDTSAYGVNRIIPKLVIAIILITVTHVIFNFFFEFTFVLHKQAGAIAGLGDSGSSNRLLSSSLGNIDISTPTTGDIVGNLGSILVIIIILFMVLICGFILLVSLIARIFILSFLLVISPLAFILSIMPFASNLGKQWWNNFFKWMFMAPVAVLIIAIGMVIASATGLGTEDVVLNESSVDALGRGPLMGLLFLAGALYMAAKIPLQWSGDFKAVMSGWQKLTKTDNLMEKSGKMAGSGAKWGATKVGGKIARKNPYLSMLTKEGWTNRSGRVKEQEKLEFNRAQQELVNKNWFGQKLVGATDVQRANMDNAVKEGYKKEYANMKLDELIKTNAVNSGNKMQQLAAIETAQDVHGGAEKLFAEAGDLNQFGNWTDVAMAGNKHVRAQEKAIDTVYDGMKTNKGFSDKILKDNVALATRIAINKRDDELLGKLAFDDSRKAVHEKDPNFMDVITQNYDTEYERAIEESILRGDTIEQFKASAEYDSTKHKIYDAAQEMRKKHVEMERDPIKKAKFIRDASENLKGKYESLNRRVSRGW